jgi:hypothetical protein
MGQADHVVTRVEDDKHVRVALAQLPAAWSRPISSRSWAAVTSLTSSSGRSRTASSGAVHDERPDSSAATTE